MRILYVSQYFPPEIGAPSARVHELSREWARLGHEVTVLTAFPHHPTGIKKPADRGVIERAERCDGIDVLRTYVWAAPNRGIARRMVSYASFMLSAILIGWLRLRGRRFDAVVATSPQLLCGLAGFVLARLFRTRFVFEVRDLWPESIIAVGAMGFNPVVSCLRSVASTLYSRCDAIVTVGEGYRRKIAELYGVDLSKMKVVHNGIDSSIFSPGPRNNPVRAAYGLGDRFVALYLGTHGMAHALNRVLDAARILKNDDSMRFVFVGEGAEKEKLKRQAADARLANVLFVDQQPKDKVREFYAACDLGLVTLRDTALFQEVLPSKIFEYLGMERPVLISVAGEARKLVEDACAGEFVKPEDAAAMAEAITRLKSDPSKLERMGKSGREYVRRNFDRAALAAKYLDILRETASNRRKRGYKSWVAG